MTIKNVCIACSIFQRELESLTDQNKIDCDLLFIDSQLHMNPSLLHQTLTPLIQKSKDEGSKVVLAYGDCHPFMDKVGEELNCKRTVGQNCSEILLGKTVYKQKLKQGAFFLMPEWVINWKEIFCSGLGLDNRQTAQSFMQTMHTYLLYLDTGSQEIPYKSLQEISEYCGLPLEILEINLDQFQSQIQKVLAEVKE